MNISGEFLMPENFNYLDLKNQLEGNPQVLLKNALSKIIISRPMPLSKKIDICLNALNKKSKSSQFSVSFTNREEKHSTQAKGKEAENSINQTVSLPTNNISNCKINVKSASEDEGFAWLNKTENVQKKEDKPLSSSRYLCYLKKKKKKSVDSNNLENIVGYLNMETNCENLDVSKQTLAEEKLFFDKKISVEASSKNVNTLKRQSDTVWNSFASCEMVKKTKTIDVVGMEIDSNKSVVKSDPETEGSTFGIPYEPVGETLFDSSKFKLNLSSSSSKNEAESLSSDIISNPEEADVIVELDYEIAATSSNSKNESEERETRLPLQEIVEKLISTSKKSQSDIRENFKKGICRSWLKNNYSCVFPSHICKYEHNARALFKKKLKKLPSNFIINIIIEMRNDLLFVDAVTEAFNILTARSKSENLLPFVCFFVFYVSDTRDTKYLTFWETAAAYFCKLSNSEDKTEGFTYLLKIFRQIDNFKQEKIIHFIELLKHPHLNLEINWKLLEPVIILKMPPSFFIEAVESCNKTKANVDEIYKEIVSRISVRSLSIDKVETLLRFCRTLEATGRLEKAGILKRRLLSKVQALGAEIDKKLYPQTYVYYYELEPRESMSCEEENEDEDVDVDGILKNDEEKASSRCFSPPPPNCYLNPSFFMEHAVVPRNFDGRGRPFLAALRRSRKTCIPKKECKRYPQFIDQVVKQIKSYDFSMAGKTLNFCSMGKVEAAAETIVGVILQMKISPDELLDFILKVALSCNSKNSSDIISSIANTMMYFFVKIDDWKAAYSILNLCCENEIDLSRGKVFASGQAKSLSQFRIVLLLIEIFLNNEKYENAYGFIEKFNLFSDEHTLESSSSDGDAIRVNIIKDFLDVLAEKKSPLLFKTVTKVWEAQGELKGPIDLTEYSSKVGG